MGVSGVVVFVVILFVVIPRPGDSLRSVWNNIRNVGRGVKSDVSVLTQPVQQTIADIGSSQCANVKKLLGVAYSPYRAASGPDLDLLTLQLRTKSKIYTLNLDDLNTNLPAEFNIRNKIVIFVHGYLSDPNKSGFQEISELFLQQGDYNVFALDSSSLTSTEYVLATSNAKFIGQRLGEVLADMFEEGMNPRDVTIVAHSLGAHVAGFAGKTFRLLTGRRLGRISGLDPAGPCFSNVEPDMRLSRDAADYVDVIHTNGGVYGIKDPIGHADYFVNGGSLQPNCLRQSCHHRRAWQLYTESVLNPDSFPARTCRDWEAFTQNLCDDSDVSYMGFSSQGYGVFYLRTAGQPPYGLWQKGVLYEMEGGLRKVLRVSGNAVNGVLNFVRFFG